MTNVTSTDTQKQLRGSQQLPEPSNQTRSMLDMLRRIGDGGACSGIIYLSSERPNMFFVGNDCGIITLGFPTPCEEVLGPQKHT